MQKNKINEVTDSNNILIILHEIKTDYNNEYKNMINLFQNYILYKDYMSSLEIDEILVEYQNYKKTCEKFLSIKLDNSEKNRDMQGFRKIIRFQLNKINNFKYKLFGQ